MAARMGTKTPTREQPMADQSVDSLRKRLGPVPAISAEDQSRRFLAAASVPDRDNSDEQLQAWREDAKPKRS